MNQYVNIAIVSKTQELDQLFTYKIDQSFKIGDKVLVPFGRGNSLREGYIFEIVEKPDYNRIKKVQYVLADDISLTSSDIELVKWMKKEYLCSFSDAIRMVIPSGTSLKRSTFYEYITDAEGLTPKEQDVLNYIKEKKEVSLKEIKKAITRVKPYLNTLEEKKLIKKEFHFKSIVKEKYKKIYVKKKNNEEILEIRKNIPKSYVAQLRLIDYILKHETGTLANLKKKLKIAKSVFDRIASMGIIDIKEVRDRREIEKKFKIKHDPFKSLTSDQEYCYQRIKESLATHHLSKFLLHGVTGSGKTEVYMHLVQEVLDENQSAIILVPEISLTPQMMERFFNRFGEKIAILHSKLSQGERFDQWKDIKQGKKKIVIGARSAIFSPVKDLGLVIIDESHENTYKSDMNPKYETEKIAEFKLKKTKGTLVLGSATPRINAYYQGDKTNLEVLNLSTRVNNKEMPPVDIVDMREELSNGNKTIFSRTLYEGINDRLKKNEQTIIFLNRKGYSSFVSCRKCGFALECSNCEIALTYHKKRNIASCSYCDYQSYIPKTCPECGSKYFKHFGIGTEQVEEITKKTFRDATVARLDSQTTRRKGSLNKIIHEFKNKKTDILVGTQMVTKGFDFENVTLVGVIAADLMLNFPDFSSSERAFQLVTQVAGRAGRGNKSGRVIVQTYEPHNYALKAASNHSFDEFYHQELKVRKAFEYPPYIELVNIILTAENENKLKRESLRFHKILRNKIANENVQFFGPHPALHGKIRNRYRYQIFLKFSKQELNTIKNVIDEVINNYNFDIYISVDVCPRNLV